MERTKSYLERRRVEPKDSRRRRDMVNSAEYEPLAPASVPVFERLPKSSLQPELREPFQERRQHARLDYKVPVMLTDATGAHDHFVTENVSKGGFAFASERLYIPGEVARVSIRCGCSTQALQANVRIVRREELGKTGRRFYAATYLRTDNGTISK